MKQQQIVFLKKGKNWGRRLKLKVSHLLLSELSNQMNISRLLTALKNIILITMMKVEL